ncbi:MAG: hypothetical protein NVS3B12_19530 [Acidimicrobiales bacterium]
MPPQSLELMEERTAIEGEFESLSVEFVQLGQQRVPVDVQHEPIGRGDPRGPSLGEPVIRMSHLPTAACHVPSDSFAIDKRARSRDRLREQ